MSLIKRPVSLEDLLRLKRAERPPAEFWEQFDRQLRAKQLAALVEKRPWWRALPMMFSGLRRYHLPLGATAILALTFITIREYQNATPSVAPELVTSIATRSSTPEVAAIELAPVNEPSATVAENTVAAEPAEDAAAASSTSFASAMPLFGAGAQPAPKDITPSARAIAANLAAAQAAAPAATRALLSGLNGFETRAAVVRAPREPLAQMTTPSEVRRSRWLSAMATTVSANDPQVQTGDRVLTHISEDRLYDEVHRFGARGDRFSVRF
jgi:hypothetical protein